MNCPYCGYSLRSITEYPYKFTVLGYKCPNCEARFHKQLPVIPIAGNMSYVTSKPYCYNLCDTPCEHRAGMSCQRNPFEEGCPLE